jgi:transcriptional regulator with PAS, ATPase and Fis domain
VITMPPLRERLEAIPPLIHGFIRLAAVRVKKDVQSVSAEALTLLVNYHWPGNLRELEHAIERAVIVTRGNSIESRDLPLEVFQKPDPGEAEDSRSGGPGTRHDCARARAVSWQSAPGGRRAEDQHCHLWRKMKQYELVEATGRGSLV